MTETRSEALLPLSCRHIDVAALKSNFRALAALIPSGTSFMAVVKADAYGHGATTVARTLLSEGATHLAVARISEGVELRNAGIDAPILVFGEVRYDQVDYMARNGLRASVGDLATAEMVSQKAQEHGVTLKIHIKIDSGMGRLGFVIGGPEGDSEAAAESIQKITAMPGIKVEGMYTHLARADETDLTHAKDQVAKFRGLISRLEALGVRPRLCHAANSAALLALPEAHLDMVRPGVALYGMWPSAEVDKTKVTLTPVMSLRARIIHTKPVPRGFAVSYGGTHVTDAPTVVATVPIGYADGYNRLLSSKGFMLVRGQKAPVIGRVCMDFTMIDVGHIEGVQTGDEVVILGTQGDASFTADDIAELTQTINYEVTSGLTARMPLVYTEE